MQTTSGGSAWGEFRRGWPTLFGATIGTSIGMSALPFYTSGLFAVPLIAEFGWTRNDLSTISMVGTLLLAVIAPLVGWTIDRFGVRLPAAISFLALAASFWAMSLLSGSFAQYAVIQIATVVLCGASTPICFTRPINATFDAMRGLALGVTIGGIGVTAWVAPRVIPRLMEAEGWRGTYQTLALVAIVGAPIVLGLLSLRPAQSAGARPAAADTPAQKTPLPFKDPLFLRLIAGFFLIAMAVGGFVMHLPLLLADAGLDPVEAGDIQSILGLAVLFGRVAVGAVIDRIFAPYVTAVLLVATAAGLALLAVGGAGFAIIAALAIGLAMGAEVDIIAYLTARYYGMKAYARFYGVLYGAFLVGVALSPKLIAELQAKADSYTPALWVSAAFLVAAATLFALCPRFKAGTPEETPEPAMVLE